MFTNVASLKPIRLTLKFSMRIPKFQKMLVGGILGILFLPISLHGIQKADLAKKFSSKITHLSPVWYELKNEGSKLVLHGRHNADRGWISDIRMKGNTLILPRVVLEANPLDLLKKKRLREKAINLIIMECKELEYDGIVLESWSRWVAYGILHNSDMRNPVKCLPSLFFFSF